LIGRELIGDTRRLKVGRLFDSHRGATRKTIGVKTAAVGDRAGFGSHLLSNLLSSTDEQRGARDRE